MYLVRQAAASEMLTIKMCITLHVAVSCVLACQQLSHASNKTEQLIYTCFFLFLVVFFSVIASVPFIISVCHRSVSVVLGFVAVGLAVNRDIVTFIVVCISCL